MGPFFRFAVLLVVLGAGAYIYMRQAQSASVGADSPAGTVDIVGVKADLMAIVRAERVHNALHGGFGSIEELRSSGDLTMARDNRGPYSYSVELGGSDFRVTATYSGRPTPLVPKRISVDQTMQFAED